MKVTDIENSIKCFEHFTSLTVTVHDLTGKLWQMIHPKRLQHCSAICKAVKLSPLNNRCIKLEVTEMRNNLHGVGDGFFHICHAGFVEWVVPIRTNGNIVSLFFAGQRMAGNDLTNVKRDIPPSSAINVLGLKLLPKTVNMCESEIILESLKQLGARISQNIFDLNIPTNKQDRPGRKEQINGFIRSNYMNPIGIHDLAMHLKLSPSRTAHVVRELFNTTLQSLINDARLRAAATLLRNTDLPVSEIATQCGAEDLSRFHRLFKSKLALTPRNYRNIRETVDEEKLK